MFVWEQKVACIRILKLAVFSRFYQKAMNLEWWGMCYGKNKIVILNPLKLFGSEIPRLSAPRPLFLPTTLVVGDSIIRNTRFFNAAIHFFPGATVPVITSKLPGLLRSLPSSIRRVILHVGTYDTAREQSELIKKDFNNLFHFLSSCDKSVYFSGPIPSLGRGVGRFSRLLSLHTWLQSTCTAKKKQLGFINNFDLFWDRSHLFRPDGIHPNWVGNKMLTANLQHTVQSTSHAWLFIPFSPKHPPTQITVPPVSSPCQSRHICRWHSHRKASLYNPSLYRRIRIFLAPFPLVIGFL